MWWHRRLSSLVILLTCPSIATPSSKIPLLFPAILPVHDESSLHAALCVQNVSRRTQRWPRNRWKTNMEIHILPPPPPDLVACGVLVTFLPRLLHKTVWTGTDLAACFLTSTGVQLRTEGSGSERATQEDKLKAAVRCNATAQTSAGVDQCHSGVTCVRDETWSRRDSSRDVMSRWHYLRSCWGKQNARWDRSKQLTQQPSSVITSCSGKPQECLCINTIFT